MADYASIVDGASDALTNAAEGGFVEEYQHRNLRVRRGRVVEQVQALATLDGLAARRSGGLFRLASVRGAE